MWATMGDLEAELVAELTRGYTNRAREYMAVMVFEIDPDALGVYERDEGWCYVLM